jgi:hypothetical protein
MWQFLWHQDLLFTEPFTEKSDLDDASEFLQRAGGSADGNDPFVDVGYDCGARSDDGTPSDLDIGNYGRADSQPGKIAHFYVAADGGLRRQMGVVADDAVVFHDSSGIDDCAASDDGTRVYHSMGHDNRAQAYGCGR